MKILLCSPTKNVGGISKWTNSILKSLPQYCPQHSLDVLSMDARQYVGETASLLIRIKQGVAIYLKYLKDFSKEVKNNKPDIVHVCSSGSLGLIRDFLLARSCNRSKIPVCYHFHFGRIPDIQRGNNWEWRLLKKVCNMASAVIVMTDSSLKTLIEAGVQNVYNVPNPITNEEIEQTNGVKYDFNLRLIVFAGHILKTKGINELFESLSGLIGYTVIIVGEDTSNLVPSLSEHYPNAFANNKITFTGQVSHNEVFKYISSGVFVLPSYTEGFPYVILEAMACGVPIISTNVGAIPDMLSINKTNPCGICVPPRDADALKTAIEKITTDKQLAKTLAENGYEKVRNDYAIKTIVSELSTIWDIIDK